MLLDLIFAASFDLCAGPCPPASMIFTETGVYEYTNCVPGRVGFSGSWNITAQCDVTFTPADNTWIPGPQDYHSQINMGQGAFLDCAVIDYVYDNGPTPEFFILAECITQ